jgi:hypothetical protein
MDAVAGSTVIETKAAAVTVSVVIPLIFPTEEVMVVLPVSALCAKPVEPTVATAVALELHVAVFVRFWVVESVYVPVAVNCWVDPTDAMEGSIGVMSIEANTSVVTDNVVEPEIEPEVAVMFVVPVVKLLASPFAPVLLLMVATVAADELHCTVVVRFCVVLLVNVPVAANC